MVDLLVGAGASKEEWVVAIKVAADTDSLTFTNRSPNKAR